MPQIVGSGDEFAVKLNSTPAGKYDVITNPYLKDRLDQLTAKQLATVIGKMHLNDQNAAITVIHGDSGEASGTFYIERSNGATEAFKIAPDKSGEIKITVDKHTPPGIEYESKTGSLSIEATGKLEGDKAMHPDASTGSANASANIHDNLTDIEQRSTITINPDGSGRQMDFYNHAFLKHEAAAMLGITKPSVNINLKESAGIDAVLTNFSSPEIKNDEIVQENSTYHLSLGLGNSIGLSADTHKFEKQALGIEIPSLSIDKSEDKIQPFASVPKTTLTVNEVKDIQQYYAENPDSFRHLPVTKDMLMNSKNKFSDSLQIKPGEESPLRGLTADIATIGHFIGLNAETMKNIGIEPDQLLDAGYSVKDIRDCHFSPEEFNKAGLTADVLFNKGLTISDLKTLDFSPVELINHGFDANDLIESGFPAESVLNANSSVYEDQAKNIHADMPPEQGGTSAGADHPAQTLHIATDEHTTEAPVPAQETPENEQVDETQAAHISPDDQHHSLETSADVSPASDTPGEGDLSAEKEPEDDTNAHENSDDNSHSSEGNGDGTPNNDDPGSSPNGQSNSAAEEEPATKDQQNRQETDTDSNTNDNSADDDPPAEDEPEDDTGSDDDNSDNNNDEGDPPAEDEPRDDNDDSSNGDNNDDDNDNDGDDSDSDGSGDDDGPDIDDPGPAPVAQPEYHSSQMSSASHMAR